MTIDSPADARIAARQLLRLAMDAYRESQYAVMEQLLEQAEQLAAPLEDLPLLADVRLWLAESRRMQQKLPDAIVLYAWLIGVALEPETSARLTDDTSLRRLASGFTDFVWCARQRQDTKPTELHQVLDDGMRWLEQVGRSQWAGPFRSERGLVFQQEERLEEARRELEAAVAMARRHPEAPGFALATYQLNLIRLLGDRKVGAFEEAITLAKEMAAAPNTRQPDRWRAYWRIVDGYIELGRRPEALRAARVMLALAQAMKQPSHLTDSYRMLAWLHRTEGRLEEAQAAMIEQWRHASRTGSPWLEGLALVDGAEVRLLQVRQACRLDLRTDELPMLLPIGTDGALALQRLRGAERFVRSLRVRAGRLEEGSSQRRDLLSHVDRLEQKIRRLTGVLTRFAGLKGLESLTKP